MNKLDVVPFSVEHLDLVDIRKIELDNIFSLPGAKERYAMFAQVSAQAFTFIVDDVILFCAGIIMLWPGVADIWMIPSEHTKKHEFLFYRTVRGYLSVLPETFKLHRLQTTSYDDTFHEKWMTKLRFKKEGVMHKYLHNKNNMVVYARTF